MAKHLAFFLPLALAACAPDSADTGHLDSGSPDSGDPDSGDPATAYTSRGDLGVGYTVIHHPREDADDLVVKAWYPAQATGSEAITYDVTLKLEGFGGATVPFLGDAALDAAPDADHGPYPLVVLSHGFAMNPEWYHPLAEHLASFGFVVLGPEHTESSWTTDIITSTVQRPADISATIDLAAAGALDGVIDADTVAVIGHSYGGYTSLAVAGARFDLDDLAERCEDVTDEFTAAYFCDPFLAGEATLAAAMGLDAAPADLWPALGDPRVDAILPMAGDAYLFGEQGLAEVTVPAMMLGGTGDTGTPWDWGAGLAYDAVSSQTRALVAFEGAEHFIPVTTCDHMPWTAELPDVYASYFCEDPAWDKPQALTQINQLSTAFLLHSLVGDAQAGDALDARLYADIDGLAVTVELAR